LFYSTDGTYGSIGDVPDLIGHPGEECGAGPVPPGPLNIPVADFEAPGTYTVDAATYIGGLGLLDYDVTMTVSNVPEPGTGGLTFLGLGALGMLLVMRKRINLV
jgi:hypothetical protein